MRTSIRLGSVSALGALIVSIGTTSIAQAAGGTPLAPGATVFPALITSGTDPGTLLADETQPFSFTSDSGTTSGSYEEAVYQESDGELTFYLQISNAAASAGNVAEGTLSSFGDIDTAVGYRVDGSSFTGTGFVDGTDAPVVAGRSVSPGDDVSWEFSPPASSDVAPGATSNLMEIATDATTYTSGTAAIIGDGTATGPGYEPAGALTTISTTANPSTGSTGSILQDSATLANTGTLDGTGSIIFNLYGPGDTGCATSLYTTTVSDITGDGPWSTTSGNNTSGYDATAAGTYHWTASFSGDTTNDSAATTCSEEPVAITAQPSISTTATPNAGPTGSTLQDSATLTNASNLDGTGSITFNLYGPGDTGCSTAIHTETVTGVSSDGPFTTTTGYLAKAPGTYNWTASFSGDSTNGAASTTCGAEPVVITGISQITSASTSCSQFAASSTSTVAQIKYSSKNGKIKTASPGGFDYWLTLTATGSPQSFTVTQLSNEKSRPFMLAPGSSAYSMSCDAVPITITSQANGAVVTFVVPASTSGLTYYVGLNFTTANVVGEANPKPKATVKYQFITGGLLGSTRDLNLEKSD